MVKNQIANSSNQIAILAFGSNRSDWSQIKISVLITIVLCRLFEMCNVYMYCSRRTRWTGCRPWQHHTMTTSAFSSCWHSQSPAFTRSSSSIIIHTHTRLTALCPGLPGWAGTRNLKSIWILLKQETVSGSCISWAICKSASRSRQARQHPTTYFFIGRMPFLPPNQQHQSTEGSSTVSE